MAEFANFPESVVALAREKAAELEDFSPPSIVINNEVWIRFCSVCIWFEDGNIHQYFSLKRLN